MEVRVAVEGDAAIGQGFDCGSDVGDLEAEDGVFVRGEIRDSRDAEGYAAGMEDGGEVVFVGEGEAEGVAVEGGGAGAVSGADDDGGLGIL